MGISNRFSVLNNLIYHAAQWGMLKQETLDATQEDLRTKTIEKKSIAGNILRTMDACSRSLGTASTTGV